MMRDNASIFEILAHDEHDCQAHAVAHDSQVLSLRITLGAEAFREYIRVALKLENSEEYASALEKIR